MGGNRQICALLSNRVPTELRGARDKMFFLQKGTLDTCLTRRKRLELDGLTTELKF